MWQPLPSWKELCMPEVFSASRAERLMACPASADLSAFIPAWEPPVRDDTVGAKAFGTHIHEILADLLNSHSDDLSPLWDMGSMLYSIALQWAGRSFKPLRTKKHVLDSAINSAIQLRHGTNAQALELEQMLLTLLAIERVTASKTSAFAPSDLRAFGQLLMDLEALASHGGPYNVMVEESLQAAWLPSGPRTTPDLVLWKTDESSGTSTIIVVDYKLGKIPVPVMHNAQLEYYLATAFEHLLPYLRHANGNSVYFGAAILQPYLATKDEWWFGMDHLNEFMTAAIQKDQEVTAGSIESAFGDHCTFCPANPHSRGDKGYPFCPTAEAVLYPSNVERKLNLLTEEDIY